MFIVDKAAAHLLDACPNTLPVAEGSKLVSTLPAKEISSPVAFPKSTPPLNVALPSTFNVVSKSTAPVEVIPPTVAEVASNAPVTDAAPVIVVVPNAAVFDTDNVPVVDIPVESNLEFAPVLPTAIVLFANLTFVFAFEPT